MRRIMNHMHAIAPWLSDSDRAALRAWCELEWLTRRVMLVLTQPDLDRDATLNGRRNMALYAKPKTQLEPAGLRTSFAAIKFKLRARTELQLLCRA